MKLVFKQPQLVANAWEDQVADTSTIVNILGLFLDIANDTLSIIPKDSNHLRQMSQQNELSYKTCLNFFDPLGALIPVTFSAKVFIQLWQQKLYWNEPLNSTLTAEWYDVAPNLTNTPQFHIPCWYPKSFSTDQLNFHTFLYIDESIKFYGTVAYSISMMVHIYPLSWLKLRFFHWKITHFGVWNWSLAHGYVNLVYLHLAL